MNRIVNMNVSIDPAGFAGPGDAALFGDVLSRFVGRYACFHYAIRLVLLVGNGGPIQRYAHSVQTGGWL